MKLLTQELAKTLPKLYSQEKVEDPLVMIKFFTPDSNWTWYVIEGQPESYENASEIEDWRFFGLVDGLEEELGYFMLSELESARGPLGLKIERDTSFTPTPLSKIRRRT